MIHYNQYIDYNQIEIDIEILIPIVNTKPRKRDYLIDISSNPGGVCCFKPVSGVMFCQLKWRHICCDVSLMMLKCYDACLVGIQNNARILRDIPSVCYHSFTHCQQLFVTTVNRMCTKLNYMGYHVLPYPNTGTIFQPWCAFSIFHRLEMFPTWQMLHRSKYISSQHSVFGIIIVNYMYTSGRVIVHYFDASTCI
jgi:hypothetical protein